MGADLSARGLVHRRGGREVLALDLQVRAGARLAVLGRNGAGKSTLLRLLAGVERPSAGTVLVDGQDPTGLGARRRSALATQVPSLLSTSARDNVELPLRWRGLPRPERRARALAALRELGVAHLATRDARGLSGGEAQRVSLARALATQPRLLLLDEPCAGLDAPSRAALLDVLEAALARDGAGDGTGATLVHVTHRADEAVRLADRVLVLVDGRVRQLAAPADLLAAPADDDVALLVGYDAVVDLGGPVVHPDRAGGRAAVVEAGLRLVTTGAPGAAVVQRVVPGLGGAHVTVDAGGQVLRAHLPSGTVLPAAGSRVRVELDPRRTALVGAGSQPNSADAFLTVS